MTKKNTGPMLVDGEDKGKMKALNAFNFFLQSVFNIKSGPWAAAHSSLSQRTL